MAENQIRGGQVRSGTIVNEQIASNAEIALSKIAGGVALDNRVTDLESDAIVTREVPSGSVNSSNVTFTLANTPVSGTEQVYLNGLLQDPGAGNSYTIAGAVITFLSAPLTGDEIHVTYGTDSYVTDPSGTPVSSGVDYGAVLNDSVAVGYQQAVIRSDGVLLTAGYNAYYQLGQGDTTDRWTLTRVGSDNNWSKISASIHNAGISWQDFTLALKTNGTLWAWGLNGFGQLGDNSTTTRGVPVQIGSATDWSQISAGVTHSAGIKTNGTLWTWGDNRNGELGQGNTTQRNVPTQVGVGTDWAKVSAGQHFTIAIKNDGSLWVCGYGGDGRPGDNGVANRTSFVRIGSASDWWNVDSGGLHALLLKTNGTLWAWGVNGNGQLGDSTTTTRALPVQIGSDTTWSKISAGYRHSAAIKSDGTLWAWGSNAVGNLGDATTTQRNSPVRIGTSTDWAHVVAGLQTTAAIKTNGTLYAWGDNTQGNLGDGTNVVKYSPSNAEVDLKN